MRNLETGDPIRGFPTTASAFWAMSLFAPNPSRLLLVLKDNRFHRNPRAVAMPHHKRQLSDADQPSPQPSLSAAALTEIDTALRPVGFTFDDGHVFADHEHAALRLLHLDPRERPYDASEKNVAVRIAMIFEAAHQVASENPGIDARSPEFWQLVKTTALKVDKTFEDAHESDLALCYVIITKFHAAWNRFGREDSETAQKILSQPLMDTQEANATHRLYLAIAD
ncbi:hypothetical protein CGMCC3_g15255 [Colletotrichum fructicola]|nr:uncharacterized protein CGMCC3_g15255 [Colletotrichum fructicola]KAE9568529.1 hypothetical protein CGMCC3_g15255 [Colletotrichum fructicola]